MSTTNHTTNYELSQYIGTDVTSYLSNYNSDMYKIDAQMKVNADDAAEAKSDAATAVATSTTAASNASAAVSTANAANTTAEAAQTAATAAQTAAGAAQTTAEAALAASASNTIGNLAPAYDPTLTYAVGDLVTYVDPETNQGKLYKCIIAIVTPEAFNINKWDDVTASEAFEHKTSLIGSVNFISTDILGDVLVSIANLMQPYIGTFKSFTMIRVSQDETRIYNGNVFSNLLVKFSSVECTRGGDIKTSVYGYYYDTSAVLAREVVIASNNAVTNNNNSSNALGFAGHFDIYGISF